MTGSRIAHVLAVGLVMGVVSPGAAQRLEVTAGWAATLPASGGRLDSTFAPVLLVGGTRVASESTQRLTVDADAGQGVEVGLDAFPARRMGVHVAFVTARADLSGVNAAYRTSLRYISAQPPNGAPAEYAVAQVLPWSATSGWLRTTAVALGGVFRTAPGRRVGARVRAGIELERYSGEIRSLAYTQFVLGGHATLFSVAHGVAMAPEHGQTIVRPHLGGDLRLRLTPRVALVAGLRLTPGSMRRIRTVPARLVNPDEASFAPGLEDVRALMGEAALVLPAARWRTLVGLTLSGG
ncbi:MAG: hypothetical protein AB7O93_08265 [Vicinamibacterales bacterium]